MLWNKRKKNVSNKQNDIIEEYPNLNLLDDKLMLSEMFATDVRCTYRNTSIRYSRVPMNMTEEDCQTMLTFLERLHSYGKDRKVVSDYISSKVLTFLESDYLDTITAFDGDCSTRVTFPKVISPFSPYGEQSLPKRMIADISVNDMKYDSSLIGIGAKQIQVYDVLENERFTELLEITPAEHDLLTNNYPLAAITLPVHRDVSVIGNDMLEMVMVKLNTINSGLVKHICCIPEAVEPVMDKLNQEFGLYRSD